MLKTKVVLFSRRYKLQLNRSLFLNHHKLPLRKEVKYLGIILDIRLTWNKHVESNINAQVQLNSSLPEKTMLERHGDCHRQSPALYTNISNSSLRLLCISFLVQVHLLNHICSISSSKITTYCCTYNFIMTGGFKS